MIKEKRVRVMAVAVLTVAVLACGQLLTAYGSLLTPSDPGTGEWPMWGGTPDRNMVSKAKGMPTNWDVKTKKNVKWVDRKSTRLNSSHANISYAVFCLKKKNIMFPEIYHTRTLRFVLMPD